jgi:hypothetical protein
MRSPGGTGMAGIFITYSKQHQELTVAAPWRPAGSEPRFVIPENAEAFPGFR